MAEKYHDPVVLREALLNQWPTYIAFLVSFINILIMWASHHNVFNVIERVDHYFLLINGMVLMAATLTPFSTAILAAHLGTDSAGLAAGVYSIVALYGALAFNLWWWAKRRELIEAHVAALRDQVRDPALRRRLGRLHRGAGVVVRELLGERRDVPRRHSALRRADGPQADAR